jgi:uncharacterized protein
MGARVLLLTGRGRYADPWHPFERTSERLREILAGFDVDEPLDVDDALGSAVHAPDLVVANLGKPLDGAPSPAPGAIDGLERLLRSTPVLAVHAAVNSFPDSELWAATIGARWVDGRSWHPEFGELKAVPGRDDGSPLRELRPLTLQDERYLDLEMRAPVVPLYRHSDDAGGLQPSVWVRESAGVRAAYDAYGHDERSYDSAEHRRLLLRLVRWLLGVPES